MNGLPRRTPLAHATLFVLVVASGALACSSDPAHPAPLVAGGAGASGTSAAGASAGGAPAGGAPAGGAGSSMAGDGTGGTADAGAGGGVALFPPSRISFSSCSDPRNPMEAMDVATSLAPELHVFLGDNVYADTEDMLVMQQRYDELAAAAEFQRLVAQAELLATWDDHDYGANDAGKYYPQKDASRTIFLDFWNEPADSPRRQHAGVYTSYLYAGDAHTLQIILLDTRTFRDNLTLNDGSGKNDYIPND